MEPYAGLCPQAARKSPWVLYGHNLEAVTPWRWGCPYNRPKRSQLHGTREMRVVFRRTKGGAKVGSKAPDFSLRSQSEEIVGLKDFLGKRPVVLYFYPKDDTPGCTKEACAFRDEYEKFGRLDAEVIG